MDQDRAGTLRDTVFLRSRGGPRPARMTSCERNPHFRGRILGFGTLASASLAVLALASSGAAAATSQDELVALIKAQSVELQKLKREVEELKRQRAPAAERAGPAGSPAGPRRVSKADEKSLLERIVEKGRKPKTFRVPGTDLDIKIGGFAKVDFISRVNGQTSGAEDLFPTSAIITKGGALRGTDSRSRVHARESRLNIEASKPTSFGDFRVFVEGDFFGGGGNQVLSNSDGFRLRHAVGELGPLLAGQFWSTLMDPAAAPNTLDFQGVPGYTFIRQAQIRYTHKFEKGFSLAAALENPESRVLNPNQISAVSARDTNIPDFIVRGRVEQEWGSLQAGVVFRNIAGGTGRGADFGVGGTVHGKINMPWFGPKDNIVFQGIYGRGVGRYIQDVAGGSADGAINAATGQLELLTVYGGYIGYQHFWRDDLRSTVVFSAAHVDTPAYLPTGAYRNAFYAAANIIYSPIPEVDLGVEVQWGQRENRDGRTGEATRIQTSAKYSF